MSVYHDIVLSYTYVLGTYLKYLKSNSARELEETRKAIGMLSLGKPRKLCLET